MYESFHRIKTSQQNLSDSSLGFQFYKNCPFQQWNHCIWQQGSTKQIWLIVIIIKGLAQSRIITICCNVDFIFHIYYSWIQNYAHNHRCCFLSLHAWRTGSSGGEIVVLELYPVPFICALRSGETFNSQMLLFPNWQYTLENKIGKKDGYIQETIWLIEEPNCYFQGKLVSWKKNSSFAEPQGLFKEV